jgi:hypothetical protein
MRRILLRRVVGPLAAMIACACVTGCGGGGESLPGSLVVPMPAGQSLEAGLGTGPPSLANTKWDIHDAAKPNDPAIASVEFGASGQIVKFNLSGDVSSNVSGAPQSMVIDEKSHTFFPPVTYVAGSYGGQAGEDVGASVFARLFSGPTEIATLTLSIFGTRSGGIINGTLGISTTIKPEAASILPGAPVGTQSSNQAVILKQI